LFAALPARRPIAPAALVAVTAMLVAVAAPGASDAATPHRIIRVSVSSTGREANDASFTPAISADGRWVAFSSDASNLVPDDYNHRRDIFLRDLDAGRITRISVSSRGQQANADSYNPSVSGDGRFVVYDSFASNLVDDDDNGKGDVFLYDRLSATTTLISRGLDGHPAAGQSGFAAITADGNTVAFESTAPNIVAGPPGPGTQIYTWDRRTGAFELITRSWTGGAAGASSGAPSVSADGRYIAFASASDTLVPGDYNQADDVFVRDRKLGMTQRVSVNSAGGEANGKSAAPSISADGRLVAFESTATNLLGTDPLPQNLPRLPQGPTGPGRGSGRTFVGDVFVHDLTSGQTRRVNVASEGTEANAESYGAAISGDGRWVAFVSLASNLVPGKSNGAREVFVHDLQTGTTERVCVGLGGLACNKLSITPSLDRNGDRIAFASEATNVVAGDHNLDADIFVRLS